MKTLEMIQEKYEVSEEAAKIIKDSLSAEKIALLVLEFIDQAQPAIAKQPSKKASAKDGKKKTHRETVLDSLKKGKKVTSEDVANATGLTKKVAGTYLWRLWNEGKIKSDTKGVYYKK